MTYDISAWVEIGNTYLIGLYARINKDFVDLTPNGYHITIGSLNGINDIIADQEIISTTYYTMHGLRINGVPTTSGLYIKVDKQSDGSVRTSKVMIK